MLLAKGADIETGNMSGTPLLNAAIHGKVGSLRALLKAGADTEEIDDYECTALHLAAEAGHCGAIKVLVHEAEIEVTIKDEEGNMPLHLAARNNKPAAVDLLIDCLSGISRPSPITRMTPLHEGAMYSVLVLLSRGAKVKPLRRWSGGTYFVLY